MKSAQATSEPETAQNFTSSNSGFLSLCATNIWNNIWDGKASYQQGWPGKSYTLQGIQQPHLKPVHILAFQYNN